VKREGGTKFIKQQQQHNFFFSHFFSLFSKSNLTQILTKTQNLFFKPSSHTSSSWTYTFKASEIKWKWWIKAQSVKEKVWGNKAKIKLKTGRFSCLYSSWHAVMLFPKLFGWIVAYFEFVYGRSETLWFFINFYMHDL
jgi:hypothetical protein